MTSPRDTARKLIRESLAKGDPVGWFEALYAVADGDATIVPWADLTVNPNLADWIAASEIEGRGRKALVVGCGLGDDAEELSRVGFDVVAFDISPTAIGWCRSRFPQSSVHYRVADLFSPPAQWQSAFDFVLEAYTLQVLPEELHGAVIPKIAGFLAPGGRLLVITRGRDRADPAGKMPWPLTRADLDRFKKCDLAEIQFEGYVDNKVPPVRRFRVEYRRSQPE